MQIIKKQKPTSLEDLPLYMIVLIVCETDLASFGKLNLISKKWNTACKTGFYFKKMLQLYCNERIKTFGIRDYILIPDFIKNEDWKSIFTLKRKKKEDSNVGTIFTSDGKGFCEGYYIDGVLNGPGVVYKKNLGLAYIGNFENAKAKGIGKRYWKNGDHYEGEFINSQMNGRGKMHFYNVGDYEGDWVDGERVGNGIMRMTNGSVYEGEWKGDAANGIGTFVSIESAFVYRGEWKDNLKEGKGVLTNKHGQYIGEFKNNNANGHGKIVYKGGSFYEGEVTDNSYNGNGFLKTLEGQTYRGQFVRGKIHGKGILQLPNGNGTYIGYVKLGNPHGNGTITYKNGHVFVGNLKKSKKSGKGEFFDSNSFKYFEGNFVDNLLDGECTYHNKEGSQNVIFKKGIPIFYNGHKSLFLKLSMLQSEFDEMERSFTSDTVVELNIN